MAELVYALVSGASESNLLGVRVPFRAQTFYFLSKILTRNKAKIDSIMIPTERTAIERQIQATDAQIDQLFTGFTD